MMSLPILADAPPAPGQTGSALESLRAERLYRRAETPLPMTAAEARERGWDEVDVVFVTGGVEASLRRLAHYDYWSDTVRRSILLDSKADLVCFGMGEETIIEIARRLADGRGVKDLRDLRGVAYALGASEQPPADALELP